MCEYDLRYTLVPIPIPDTSIGADTGLEYSARSHIFLVFCVSACCTVEAPAWQLDQREEEEEADEGQQRSQGAAHRLRALYERPAGAATGRAARRALSRDHQDVGQRVEQAGRRGEAGEPGVS